MDEEHKFYCQCRFMGMNESQGFRCMYCGEDIQPNLGITVTPKKTPEDTPAVKHDDGKWDPTMLSFEMVKAVSEVRGFGAKKYEKNNWKKGFKYTRSLAAALRHVFAFLSGENADPESGLSHLAHAICCLEHCLYDTIHHPENDDRKSS